MVTIIYHLDFPYNYWTMLFAFYFVIEILHSKSAISINKMYYFYTIYWNKIKLYWMFFLCINVEQHVLLLFLLGFHQILVRIVLNLACYSCQAVVLFLFKLLWLWMSASHPYDSDIHNHGGYSQILLPFVRKSN